MKNTPTLTIIAGVNGSGKTTFALDYFSNSKAIFINADLIATGLSSNNPDNSQFEAGKLMLLKIQECIRQGRSFAVETTLSGKNYLQIIKQLKQDNWHIEMLYLYLPSVDLSLQRVAERVQNGGHNIKAIDIKRRYGRSVNNLINDYIKIVDRLVCFDNSDCRGVIFIKNRDAIIIYNQALYNNILEYKNAG